MGNLSSSQIRKPHNFREDSQPLELVGDESDATEPAAPTNSTTFISDSQRKKIIKAGGGGPGLSSFVHMPKSPPPNVDDPNYNELVAAPPDHTAVRPPRRKQSEYPLPAPGATNNGGAPGLTPFIHMNNSPCPNNDDDPLPSRDEVNAPGLTPFVRNNNSPYPNNDDPAPGRYKVNAPGLTPFVRGNNSSYRDVDVDPNNGSSTNTPKINLDKAASLTNTCVNTSRKCFVCLSKNNWPQILPVSQSYLVTSRGVPIVKQMHIYPAVAMTYPETTTIYNARHNMSAHRTDFLVLIDSNSSITGVVTKKDIPNRDVAFEFNTPVSKVMTTNFVYSDTPALEAVQKMAKGNFVRLLVIENSKVIGLIYRQVCGTHNREEGHTILKGGCIKPAMAAIAQWNLAQRTE